MDAKTLMSVEEFDRLAEPDELSYELDEGELVVMTKPRPLHNRIAERLFRALDRYLETYPVGEVFIFEYLFVLGPTIKRAPDVSFLRSERAKKIDPHVDIPGAPDLAVEVLSPTDTVSAMRRKIRQYFAAGTQCVWIVYPETREVEIWKQPSQPQKVLQETDVLEDTDLLPGFALRVGALFG
ncbi:MAG TPA: Uma2 family endonuclease [Bryobacteraceae bacterium]|jgi:Uma2 family endonuclease|nr:Uma2 family endonuclease [Bryobacteraceae bacterium]